MKIETEKIHVYPPEDKGSKRIAIITLIVVIVGGGGLFSIGRYFYYNRVIFDFNKKAVLTGHLGKNKEKTLFLIFGTVINKGKIPLNPDRFEAEIKFNDRWLSLDKTLIPEDLKINYEEYNITMDDVAADDLQEYNKAITMDKPARGKLLFISAQLDANFLLINKKRTFKIICIDELGNKYEKIFLSSPSIIEKPKKLFKQDLIIIPK